MHLKQYRLFSGFLPQDIPLDAIYQLTNAVRHVLGCAQAEYLIQLLERQILCLWDEPGGCERAVCTSMLPNGAYSKIANHPTTHHAAYHPKVPEGVKLLRNWGYVIAFQPG